MDEDRRTAEIRKAYDTLTPFSLSLSELRELWRQARSVGREGFALTSDEFRFLVEDARRDFPQKKLREARMVADELWTALEMVDPNHPALELRDWWE